MGQPKIIRAPSTLLYWILFKFVKRMAGISLWYPVELGRRAWNWHHLGIVLSAHYIGEDVQLRQNTTVGIPRTDRLGELPIIGAGMDIGASTVIVGAVVVGQGALIGANAVVTEDVSAGGAVVGNPARISPPRKDLNISANA